MHVITPIFKRYYIYLEDMEKFFEMFPICECCLVRTTCLTTHPFCIVVEDACDKFKIFRKNPRLDRRSYV
jgi:hypothetical protein